MRGELADPAGWLDAERPNLVAVVAYAAENGWPGHASRLSAVLAQAPLRDSASR